MVVPRSSTYLILTSKITEDQDYCLFNVTLFQKVVDDFCNKAREKRYVIREFQWDPEKLSTEKRKLQELVQQEKEQLVNLF